MSIKLRFYGGIWQNNFYEVKIQMILNFMAFISPFLSNDLYNHVLQMIKFIIHIH